MYGKINNVEPPHITCRHRKYRRVFQKNYYGTYEVGKNFCHFDYSCLQVYNVMKGTS